MNTSLQPRAVATVAEEPGVQFSGEERKRLADLVSSLARKVAGRGPLAVKIRTAGWTVEVVMHGFLTPLEETLVRRGENRELVHLIRERLLEEAREAWEDLFRQEFGLTVHSLRGFTDVAQNKRTVVVGVSRASQGGLTGSQPHGKA